MAWSCKCVGNIFAASVNRYFPVEVCHSSRATLGIRTVVLDRYINRRAAFRIRTRRMATHSSTVKNDVDDRKPGLKDFMQNFPSPKSPSAAATMSAEYVPYLDSASLRGDDRKGLFSFYHCDRERLFILKKFRITTKCSS